MMHDGRENQYDENRRQKAVTFATLRTVAVVYFLYLAWTILRDSLQGASALPVWLSWTSGIVFAAAAVLFALYTWRRYYRDLRPAHQGESERSNPSGEEGHET